MLQFHYNLEDPTMIPGASKFSMCAVCMLVHVFPFFFFCGFLGLLGTQEQ